MIRSTHLLRAFAVWAVLIACACAPRIAVTTQRTPGVDWMAFETYTLVPPPDARTRVREILETDVTRELEARGYRATVTGSGDLLVVVQTKTRQAERRVFAESPGGCCEVQSYVAGTLVIGLFDRRTGSQVWRGTGEVDVESLSERQLDETVARAVTAVLAKLPARGAPSASEAR